LGSKPQQEIKKSLEPLSILAIGGAFILGGIANGFLGKIGSDAYDSIKSKITELFQKKAKEKKHEALLVFSFLISVDEYHIEVETILTNPTSEDIDNFLKSGLHQLDSLVLEYFDKNAGLRRITTRYENKELHLIFGVRKDAVPMFPEEDYPSKSTT
jgi:hypothetical protein